MSDTEYRTQRHPMVSGQAEAEKRLYIWTLDRKGLMWLVACQDNAGDNVYVEGDPDDRPQGFAGSTLTFPLVGGGEMVLKAPWHSSSGALFEATDGDVDVRDQHRTFVVIAKRRVYDGSYGGVYQDILYQDQDPRGQVGHFNRGRVMAQDLANVLGYKVYCYSESVGGSSSLCVNPEDDHE